MKPTKKQLGLTLTAAAAALFASGCSLINGEAVDAPIQCTGINACKGTSECQTPDSSCKGQNSCQGDGWIRTTKDECLRRGGEVMF